MPHIPVHPSAEKRHRQSVKRQARNRVIKTRVRTAAKNAAEAIAGSDREKAQTALRTAASLLQKAASKGAIKRNTAARKIARLSRRLHRAQAAATT
ncbi:MAG TPA: 30S ribosomal protein S20 [Candidatus Binataceae bacterium]|nr:30S ribosomal protein S20 [Candidatus Binataceae bacterium]